MTATEPLLYETLRDAVRGGAVAIRAVQRLQAMGGKVAQPTYGEGRDGHRDAMETRYVDGVQTQVVLLNSIPAQANRMEQALKQARSRGEVKFPLYMVDFGEALGRIGRVTALDAPHRIADAIFRDSLLDGVPFPESPQGKAYSASTVGNATALLAMCPTALIYGVWDSAGARGGLGNKFPRIITSEIVGFGAIRGVKTASRIDPLPIAAKVKLYKTESGGWTLLESEAKKEKDKPVPVGKQGKPSEIVLGNIMPSISEGGVSITHAEISTVLSLPGLRRLRFPNGANGGDSDTLNEAVRVMLAALGLLGVVLQYEEGFDLRSGCLLVPEAPLQFEFVRGGGQDSEHYALPCSGAEKIFEQSVQVVRDCGFDWNEDDVVLYPSSRLIDLINKSLELSSDTLGE